MLCTPKLGQTRFRMVRGCGSLEHLQRRTGQPQEKHNHVDQLPCHMTCHQRQSNPEEESAAGAAGAAGAAEDDPDELETLMYPKALMVVWIETVLTTATMRLKLLFPGNSVAPEGVITPSNEAEGFRK